MLGKQVEFRTAVYKFEILEKVSSERLLVTYLILDKLGSYVAVSLVLSPREIETDHTLNRKDWTEFSGSKSLMEVFRKWCQTG